MKILHVVDSINRDTGGPARSVPQLADAMVESGNEVTVLANDYRELGDSQETRHARRVLVPARRLPFRFGAWSPGLAATMDREIRSAEVVHLHGLWLRPNHLAARLAKKNGKPYFVSPRGMLETWSTHHRRLRKQVIWLLIEKQLIESAAGLHATSEAEAESLNRLWPNRRAIVSPNGIELPGAPPSREIIDSKFPECAGKRILLFLSRLHPKKGLRELIQAWGRLAADHSEWILVIAGDDFDDHRRAFELQAAPLIADRRIVFTGDLEGTEKAALLGASELFTLPSHSENFGIVIGEALAAGKPVLTTTATPWEWIQETRCGWWIPPGENPLQKALASALALSPGELARMGRAGPPEIKSRFNWTASSQILLSAYRSALNP